MSFLDLGLSLDGHHALPKNTKTLIIAFGNPGISFSSQPFPPVPRRVECENVDLIDRRIKLEKGTAGTAGIAGLLTFFQVRSRPPPLKVRQWGRLDSDGMTATILAIPSPKSSRI